MGTTVRSRIVLLVGYLLLGVVGLAMLGGGGNLVTAFLGVLVLIVVVVGLAMVAYLTWFDRHRPGPRLAAAPSGDPATHYPRSRFPVLMAVLISLALVGWLGAAAVSLYRHGHPGWSVLFALLALFVLVPVPLAATRRVQTGGLWLTRAGVEHRDRAVGWAVPWPDVQAVRAGEPVVLSLRAGARPRRQHTMRWCWQPSVRSSDTVLGFSATYLAGGNAPIAAALEHYLADPGSRDRLGTPQSLSRSSG